MPWPKLNEQAFKTVSFVAKLMRRAIFATRKNNLSNLCRRLSLHYFLPRLNLVQGLGNFSHRAQVLAQRISHSPKKRS